jgi:hypothetical protein
MRRTRRTKRYESPGGSPEYTAHAWASRKYIRSLVAVVAGGRVTGAAYVCPAWRGMGRTSVRRRSTGKCLSAGPRHPHAFLSLSLYIYICYMRVLVFHRFH